MLFCGCFYTQHLLWMNSAHRKDWVWQILNFPCVWGIIHNIFFIYMTQNDWTFILYFVELCTSTHWTLLNIIRELECNGTYGGCVFLGDWIQVNSQSVQHSPVTPVPPPRLSPLLSITLYSVSEVQFPPPASVSNQHYSMLKCHTVKIRLWHQWVTAVVGLINRSEDKLIFFNPKS